MFEKIVLLRSVSKFHLQTITTIIC